MLSRNFRLQKVGNLNWLQKNYNFSQIAFSIDELVVLNVSRGEYDEEKFFEHVRLLNEECFIPIAAGGGIRTLNQARKLLRSGADKITVNTLIAEAPDIICQIAEEFGEQCVVASIDVKKVENTFTIWTENGFCRQKKNLEQWLDRVFKLPVGELYLNSIDQDGTGHGYMMELLDYIPPTVSIPVILAGGAGNHHHLSVGLNDPRIDAVATAHLFNFVGDGLEKARSKLFTEGFNLAKWDAQKAKDLKESVN
ncbi:MAG: HisA/HisF-related TIM barrel protein [Nitrospinota bacterium]